MKNKDYKKHKKDKKNKKPKRLKWVVPGIRVRIISKKFLEGKYYMEKVMITDDIEYSSFWV